MSGVDDDALAVVGGNLCTDLLDVTSDLSALDGSGFWAVVLPFDAEPICMRFGNIKPTGPSHGSRPQGRKGHSSTWQGPRSDAWTGSMNRSRFLDSVEVIRTEIAAGNVYQVNLTRRLKAALPSRADCPAGAGSTDIAALGSELSSGNPAPFSAMLRVPSRGIHIASASPELYLSRRGNSVRSSPIKGTASSRDGFLGKDFAENLMIVDLVRNDLGRVCEWGSVRVPKLFDVEEHPGLYHLVSTVEGTLRHECGWTDLIAATFPPGSVTGAPKIAALEIIDKLEPESRGVYCGAIGWVDTDTSAGDLNVAIRTFWIEDDVLNFGTGGAITFDSEPDGEWAETELKARKLLQVAQGVTQMSPTELMSPTEQTAT